VSRRSLVLLTSVLLIPLVFTAGGIDPAFSLRLILLAVATLTLIWDGGRRLMALSALAIVLTALCAVSVVSIAWATNSGEAIYVSSALLLYLAFFVVGGDTAVQNSRAVARACTILALIVSAIGLAQFYDVGFSWVPGGGPPSATMTTKNLLSSFLFLLFPFVLYSALTDERRWQYLSLIAWTLAFLAILIAQTRAVWLGSIVFAVVSLIGFFVFVRERAPHMRSALLLGTVSTLAVAYVTIFHVSSRVTSDEPRPGAQTRPFMSYNPSDTSASMRLNVWKHSLRMIGEHPIGVGAGNWKIMLPAYGLASFPKYVQDGTYQWTHSHNDFIEQTAELGLLGGVTYIAVFILGAIAALGAIRKAADEKEKLLLLLLGASILGFGVISFFDFPKTRVEHMMIFMLVLAMVSKPYPANIARKTLRIPPVLLTVLVLPAFGFGLLHLTSETHEQSILELRQEQDWPAVVQECDKAYNSKLLSLDELATPVLYYRAEAEFMQNDLNSALLDNLAALKADPNHIYTLNNIGSCYTRLRNFDSAKVFYTRALAISPNFEESLLNLTALYYNERDYARAMQYVNRCDTTAAGSRAQEIAQMVRAKLH
jgi:O-antigen ligase